MRKKCRLAKENVSDFENEEEHVPCEWLGNVELEVIVEIRGRTNNVE